MPEFPEYTESCRCGSDLNVRGVIPTDAKALLNQFREGHAICRTTPTVELTTDADDTNFGRLWFLAVGQLAKARQALVATGYFTTEQVGDDIAPRITELWSHVQPKDPEVERRGPGPDDRCNCETQDAEVANIYGNHHIRSCPLYIPHTTVQRTTS